jgi:hypothetical protein
MAVEVPLPESKPISASVMQGGRAIVHGAYTGDQLIAYGNARARAATERAAQVCRERCAITPSVPAWALEANNCADAILVDAGIKGDGTNDPAKKD